MLVALTELLESPLASCASILHGPTSNFVKIGPPPFPPFFGGVGVGVDITVNTDSYLVQDTRVETQSEVDRVKIKQ